MRETLNSRAMRPLSKGHPQTQNSQEITGNLLSQCNYIFIGIVLVLHVEYINKFDEIHMSLVLYIFTRRWKSYRHVDETTIDNLKL